MADRTPLLIYDGACSFCRLWIDRWKAVTGDRVTYIPAAEARGRSADLPRIDPELFKESVVFVDRDGRVRSGAHAVFASLASAGRGKLLALYKRSGMFARAAESGYKTVATHRDEMYLLTRIFWGKDALPSEFNLSRWIFLKGVGVIYLIAFLSLLGQLPGLIGSNGITPVELFLQAVHTQAGDQALYFLPTLAWFDPSDGFLTTLAWTGIVASIALVAGFAQRYAAIVCWVCYLSLFTAGQLFMSFQWDILLLETGFLTIFAAPGRLASFAPSGAVRRSRDPVRWLIWILLFRLMFMSGVVKLTAGDISWWNLSALTFHYETQCIPNPLSWHIHNLPAWFHGFSAFVMFVVELAVPFFIFMPRRFRRIGAWTTIGFQLIIILTGNYTFFNLLAIVLCGFLFDDRAFGRRAATSGERTPASTTSPTPASSPVSKSISATSAGPTLGGRLVGLGVSFILLLNFLQLVGLVIPRSTYPEPVLRFMRAIGGYHIVNSYGLFRVMTKDRPEIVIEGSRDGQTWTEYEFKYKPGDLSRTPPFVMPHQPRLDWQMWFAALSSYERNGWFVNLAIRLLEGSPEVLSLLGPNPFADSPPTYVRALLYDYRFTTPEERESTGNVWKRTLVRQYMPPLSLNEGFGQGPSEEGPGR